MKEYELGDIIECHPDELLWPTEDKFPKNIPEFSEWVFKENSNFGEIYQLQIKQLQFNF